MNKISKIAIAGSAVAILCFGAMFSGLVPNPLQPPRRGPMQPDMVLDAAQRQQVLGQVIDHLNGYYVFPDKAKAMAAELRARDERGEYNRITSAEDFAHTLTADVQRISGDRHLDVAYSAAALPPKAEFEAAANTSNPESLVAERKRNFGVTRAERLPLNIGYVDLRAFSNPEGAAGKFAAAMSLLADTDALIIDLRMNQGGEPATVALLASYLFEQKTRLNDIYDRREDKTTQFWTDTPIGPNYGSRKKVYLLTSNDTFSAAEDFAYALKNLKRATLVGETTGGGAHPGSEHWLTEHFAMIVPSGRTISPITNTDWEGVGVQPDVSIDADQALDKAQSLYLTELLATEQDETMRRRINERLAALN